MWPIHLSDLVHWTFICAIRNEGGRVIMPLNESASGAQARQKLLAWYDVNHRILPWRRNSSSQRAADGTESDGAPADLPQQQFIYFVWVSEVMSQQTQVTPNCKHVYVFKSMRYDFISRGSLFFPYTNITQLYLGDAQRCALQTRFFF